MLYCAGVKENQNPHFRQNQSEVRHSSGYWIEKLGLRPHPEGGFFRQTYKSDQIIAGGVLPGFTGARAASTAIYFLLDGENFSAFHRLGSDEVWHFYAGSPLVVHVIEQSGVHSTQMLGKNADLGRRFRRLCRRGAGSRPMFGTGKDGLWWDARSLRDLSSRILRWVRGSSW